MPIKLTPEKMPYYEIVPQNPIPGGGIVQYEYLTHILQAGTGNPASTPAAANTITEPTYLRTGAGAYTITAATATWTAGKTFIIIGANNSPFQPYIRCYRSSDTILILESYTSGGVASDDLMNDLTLQILITF